MPQELSVLTKIRETFSTEEIIFQYSVLGYKVDAYFLKYRLAIEVDEKGHQDRDFECEIERQKALEKEPSCKFIRINPVKGLTYGIHLLTILIRKHQNLLCKL